jgi:hypothetical protein
VATLPDMERALQNAHNAGDIEAARVLAAAISRARADRSNLIPGSPVQEAMPAPADPSLGQRIVGAAETGLSLATGAVGGMVGVPLGTLAGIAQEMATGPRPTPGASREQLATEGQAARRRVEGTAIGAAQALTYSPRTQVGREMAQTAAETLGQILPPVLPILAAPGAVLSGMRQAAPVARQAAIVAAPVAQAVAAAPGRAVQAVRGAVGMGEPDPVALTAASQSASVLNRRAAGSAGLPRESERRTVAEMMPVPFSGPSALTAGQASRNFAQLQFEKESAKLGEVGAPLRERVGSQTATMIQNFDALIDRAEPLAVDPIQIGRAVDRALVNRVEVERRRIRSAYDRAEQAGQMSAPVQLTPFAAQIDEFSSLEGLVPMVGAVRKEAVRLGAIAPDESGVLQVQPIPIRTAETLRQFVNQNTDWTDRREALIGRRINESIDAATESAGGDLYRAARSLRAQFADEFENVGLTAKLLNTKRGTSERSIAFGDVFDKVVINSPIDELNKVRSTLLRSGPEGRQAWADMKAAGIRYIRDRATGEDRGAVGRDEFGNPLISPAALNKAVRELDQDGKLESLYGKRQAQVLRDLAELSIDIYTAPPGAVNFSNTASALQVALDSLGTWAVTGIPGPAATGLTQAVKYVKNRKTRARIAAALQGRIPENEATP